jgi:hypothetical protein
LPPALYRAAPVGIPLAQCNNGNNNKTTMAAAAAAATTTMILGLGSQLLMHALCNNGNNNTEDGCITEWPC